MPQNPEIIATKAVSGEVLVFDRTQHPSQPSENSTCQPEIRLTGHDSEGYGVSWNANLEGHIISGSEDKKICYWDITAYSKENNSLEAVRTFNGHSAVVNVHLVSNRQDVNWHPLHDRLFASVGDDKKLMM